jgi:hypothetical protein
MSDAALRCDFDACVTLYQDFIKQTSKSKTTPTVGISSEVRTNAGGSKRKSEAVEDRYYTKAEYDALSADAKRELATKRLKRGHKPGARDSKVLKGAKAKEKSKDSNAEVIKNLKAVKRSVAQLTKQTTPADDESSGLFTKTDSEGEPKKVTSSKSPNRSNSALTRQTKKASK